MISERGFNQNKKECYCITPELIENYDKAMADTTQIWHCHHRLETHNSDGERRLVDLTRDELNALGMYYNRPPEELIFLTDDEHTKLHFKGKALSKETRAKMSKRQKGRVITWGSKISEAKKGHTTSDETKRKISEGNKGKIMSDEAKSKISASRKGKHLVMVNGRRTYVD